MSSFVPFNVTSPLEIMGFGQVIGETFKKAWERVLELHRRTQPKIELSILIKHFLLWIVTLISECSRYHGGGTLLYI